MTELLEPVPAHDRRLVARATGTLADLNGIGLLEPADVHVATRLGALGGESDPDVLLAVALAVRGVRRGSVCVDLAETVAEVAERVAELLPHHAWPDVDTWQEAVAASPLVAAGVLRHEGPLLYLDRYHRLETQVCADLGTRLAASPPAVDETALAAGLQRIRGDHLSAEQEAAAVRTVRGWTTVLTGGPGTGKTTTVARALVLVADQAAARGERVSVALAAPTGKAAARLQEAVVAELATLDEADRELVGRPEAMTLHRLLGWRPDNSTRFRHDRSNRLKYDLVVVDESSMVDLTMMGRLLEAVRPASRLLLVGDPHQLTSVGAGAVLADVVRGVEDAVAASDAGSPVAALTTNFRSETHIRDLAEALRAGDEDLVLEVLRSGSEEVELVETDDPASVLRSPLVEHALSVREAARAGDAAEALRRLDRHRLLCAHREGPAGVRHWNELAERWLAEALGVPVLGEWYAGRPLLVTANDYTLDVYNGETGVAVAQPGHGTDADRDGAVRAWISGSDGRRDLAPGRLDAVETMHAMTIHKSQGSQVGEVTVLLPPVESRLLTRELFYTAVTRAQHRVRVVGSEESVRSAVRREALRASGLRPRVASLLG